ncbi:DUF4416 family protein [candidate division KSB1 bacterium]|nr:DUF4416 family protein [candidate division KSB1 bacterium]RQW01707.1 MAG: DUF4416 family protein [candidate division KSB1 bacterium]
MGEIRFPKDVCLICALCYADEGVKDKAIARLVDAYGPIQFASDRMAFSYTSYYEKEMGRALEKEYLTFSRCMDPAALPAVKTFTNELEKHFAQDSRRTINLDPGYIEAAKLILATTKNYNHRIYIGNGIYGDVQLYWQNGAFHPNPWTYPDYRENTVRQFFAQVRVTYFNHICRG